MGAYFNSLILQPHEEKVFSKDTRYPPATPIRFLGGAER